MTDEIVQHLPIGVIIVDREMSVLRLNPAAEELTGYATSDVAGTCLSDLLGPALCAKESALRQAVETGQHAEPRVTVVACAAETCSSSRQATSTAGTGASRPDRRRLLVGAAAIEGPGGQPVDGIHPVGYLLTLQETGPFHQIRADKVSRLAHDIRGPLASIRAYTELLVDGVDEDRPQLRRQFLEVIDERTSHLTDLIVNLVGLVQRDLGHLKMTRARLSLRDVASQAVAEVQAQARQKDARLVLQAADDPHSLVGDRDALLTLLKNLITNAVKFGGPGKDVVVSLRRAEGDHVVTVTDEGCGIPPEAIPHIFEPFYRGRGAVEAGIEGSGLGLALVKAIAEGHGAEIAVKSQEGKGTSVTIRLPAGDGTSRSS